MTSGTEHQTSVPCSCGPGRILDSIRGRLSDHVWPVARYRTSRGNRLGSCLGRHQQGVQRRGLESLEFYRCRRRPQLPSPSLYGITVASCQTLTTQHTMCTERCLAEAPTMPQRPTLCAQDKRIVPVAGRVRLQVFLTRSECPCFVLIFRSSPIRTTASRHPEFEIAGDSAAAAQLK